MQTAVSIVYKLNIIGGEILIKYYAKPKYSLYMTKNAGHVQRDILLTDKYSRVMMFHRYTFDDGLIYCIEQPLYDLNSNLLHLCQWLHWSGYL